MRSTAMRVKNIIEEDIVNYKETSMFISTCFCDWKCCTEIGADICSRCPSTAGRSTPSES